MVGHKLLEELVERGATAEWDIVTFCEESRPAYDRVGLSSFFSGTTAEDLSLVSPGFFVQVGLTVHLGDRVASIDTKAGQVVSARGAGSPTTRWCWPPARTRSCRRCPGDDRPGASSTARSTTSRPSATGPPAAGRARSSAAACSAWRRPTPCKSLGLETHVVEFAPRLMGVQVDDGGGAALRRRIEELGVTVHTGDVDQGDPAPAPTARSRRCTSADGRRRRPARPARRHGRLLGRHPSPRRAGQGGRARRWASAAA